MSTSNSILKNEKDIIEYLEKNLNFFQNKDSLVEKLILEHPAGVAVSLIERQIDILRKQNTQLTHQLNDLFSIAKDNEKSTQKMHNLTLSLLSCQYLHEASALLESQLVKEFSVDSAAVKLLAVGNALLDSESTLRLDENSPQAKELKKLIHKREPVCGFFEQLNFYRQKSNQQKNAQNNKEERKVKQQLDMKSMAVMPLFVDKNNCFGALILASEDKDHFSPDSGTLFLKNLAEIVSYSFVKYL